MWVPGDRTREDAVHERPIFVRARRSRCGSRRGHEDAVHVLAVWPVVIRLCLASRMEHAFEAVTRRRAVFR